MWEAARLDVTRACLDAFAPGGRRRRPRFPFRSSEMIHGAAVTEAVVQSAASGANRVTSKRISHSWISATDSGT